MPTFLPRIAKSQSLIRDDLLALATDHPNQIGLPLQQGTYRMKNRDLRVLFFIEPVTFRDNPLLLLPWIEMIDAMVKSSAGRIEAHLVTSRALVSMATADYASREALIAKDILEPFGFDRVAYMRDLCIGDGTQNDGFARSMMATRARVMPDIVVSWTENSTIRRVFTGIPILYSELGPMPRSGFVPTIHLDPFGHQIASAFDLFAEPRWDEKPFESLVSAWLPRFLHETDKELRNSGMADWLATLAAGRRKIVVALQPPDWLTYEGIGPHLDPMSLLRRTAAEADPDDLVIPQWHATQHPPSATLLADLQRDHPNIAVPPDGLQIARTECLLPHVDRLVTVSSNVALAAAILGKELSLLGRCKFSALTTQPGGRPIPRTDLIPFVVGSYCRPLSDWTGTEGAFFDRLRDVAENPQGLLVSPPSTTGLEGFLV